MLNVAEKIYQKYAFAFPNRDTFLSLIDDIPAQELLSADNDYYLGPLLEERIRKYIQENITQDNYQIIHNYINREVRKLPKDDYLEFLMSIAALLQIGNIYGSDNLAQKLLEDNLNLINICGTIVKDNKYYFQTGQLKELVSDDFSAKLLYAYCDLMELDFTTNENTSIYSDMVLPPFSNKDQEYTTLSRAKQGEAKALEDIICRFLRMVYKEANWYKSNFNAFDDLVNQGVIGIIYAVRSFDFSHGVSFSTYVKQWIRQSILRYLERNSGCIRVSDEYRRLYRRYKETEDKLMQELGREPRLDEIALSINVDLKKLINIINLMDLRICLDMPIKTDEIEEGIGNLIPDESIDIAVDTETKASEVLLRNVVLKVGLTPREYQVVILRFGFINNTPLVRPLIAEIMNVTPQRISQLEKAALEKIENSKLFDQYLQSYDDYQEKLATLALMRTQKLPTKSKKE